MDPSDIIHSLRRENADADDLIVLNGGEPTMHPDFYTLLSELQDSFCSQIAVYSNGSILMPSKLKKHNNTCFIIPIHGTKEVHDNITQTKNSFQRTLKNLHELQKMGIHYKIKFIVNEAMISEEFNIRDCLIGHELSPAAIIIARLNHTKKAEMNHVTSPSFTKMAFYIQKQVLSLHKDFKILFLDIPICQIKECVQTVPTIPEPPAFYFSDPNHEMQIRKYYKEVLIGSHCDICRFRPICRIMKDSYLTLSFQYGVLRLERE